MKRKFFPHVKAKTYAYPGMFIERSQPEEVERRPELFLNAKRLVRDVRCES
jgi:hypothetical protein